MSKRSKSEQFPATDDKFNSAFPNLVNHLTNPDPTSSAPTVATYTRLGLNTTTQYNPLLAALGNATTSNTWLYVYPLVKQKATRTGTLVTTKNTLRKKALAIIRLLRKEMKILEETTPGTLTAADKQFLFIPDPNPRTSSAATLRSTNPVPELNIHTIKHLEHHLDSRDPSTAESRGLPEGIYFIWIKRYIGTTPPTDQSQFTHLLFSGKFNHVSSLPSANVNQTAWYTAAYISTIGEVGDWSPFVSATITIKA